MERITNDEQFKFLLFSCVFIWNSSNGGNSMSRAEGAVEYHCNWAVFSKAVHSIIKEVPTLDSNGGVLDKDDYRWKHAKTRLINTVFEPSGGDRGYNFFDEDAADNTIRAELKRRLKNKLTL